MRNYAIIPIFIPHSGCPHDCVFCNQKKITAREQAPTKNDITATIERNLRTIECAQTTNVEIGFFGGSFTGIPMVDQSRYLSIAKNYKDEGRVHGIRLSTRPDYIDEAILENLIHNSVDLIELGVQSFDDEVLLMAERGHDTSQVKKAAELIKTYGFDLGIQLMIGLPGDTHEKSLYSARELVKLKPKVARLYPTVILNDTKLMDMYKGGYYIPFSEEKMLETATDMYEIINSNNINIIRIGLKSTDLINTKSNELAGDYHPAFSEMVQGNAFLRKMTAFIEDELKNGRNIENGKNVFSFYCNPRDISKVVGHKGHNRNILKKKYPCLKFAFKRSEIFNPGTIKLLIE